MAHNNLNFRFVIAFVLFSLSGYSQMADSVRTYIDSSLTLLKQNSLYAKKVNWCDIERRVNGQLVGDFFKACSLILGFQLIAKKMTAVYIVTEILSSIILYTASMLLISGYGSEGAVMGHAVTYGVYLLMLGGYFAYKQKGANK